MRFQNVNIRNILNESLNYGGIIIDVRSQEEFTAGHIPMAINLPLGDIRKGNYSLPRGKQLILYCENGGRSTVAARILSDNGFRVVNAVGGLNQYNGAITKKSCRIEVINESTKVDIVCKYT